MSGIPNTRSTAKSSHVSRYVEVTSFVLRDLREPPKRGLAKVLAESKEQAKSVFVEHKARVIITHANGTEQSFEGVKNQNLAEVMISSPWCADSPSRSDSRSRTPTQFCSGRV